LDYKLDIYWPGSEIPFPAGSEEMNIVYEKNTIDSSCNLLAKRCTSRSTFPASF
jgi:hypothetical protein